MPRRRSDRPAQTAAALPVTSYSPWSFSMPRHTDIPSLVYHNLRAIHESRLKRLDADMAIPHLTNQQIFALMPDCQQINWSRGQQEAIMVRTLSAMHTEALLAGLR